MRIELGGLVAPGVPLAPGFAFCCEVVGIDLLAAREPFADAGVPSFDPRSSRFWLLTLFPLVLTLGVISASPSSMLPLKVRFLGKGVSRSKVSDGIGKGLDVRIGILDPLLRTIGVL